MTLAATIAEALGRNALAEAIDAAVAAVRETPADSAARHLLIDLLILDADYERADRQCAMAASLSVEDAVGFGRLRAELRGMAARAAFFEQGAVPEIPGGPTDSDALALRLAIADRENDRDSAATILAALDASRVPRTIAVNGQAVDDWRDGDDRIPHALEAITPGGAYIWVDAARIAEVTLAPMARPRDWAFRPAEIRLVDGAAGTVLLPAIYHGVADAPAFKLGRETAWEAAPSGITIGRGQRCFLAGDALLPLHELETFRAGDLGGDVAEAAHG